MKSKSRLDMALVVLVASACLAVFTMGGNAESFHGTVSATGAKYVLNAADGVYELDGSPAQLAAFAGHRATLVGKMEDGRIHVSTISAPRSMAVVATP